MSDLAFQSLLTQRVRLWWPKVAENGGQTLEPIAYGAAEGEAAMWFPAAFVALDPPGAWLAPSGEPFQWTHRLYLADYKYVKDASGAKVALAHGWKAEDASGLTYRILGAMPITDLETGLLHHVEVACDLEG